LPLTPLAAIVLLGFFFNDNAASNLYFLSKSCEVKYLFADYTYPCVPSSFTMVLKFISDIDFIYFND
jgi:hypothetical protein